MELLLQKYPPAANVGKAANKQFEKIANRQELWVEEYPPGIASLVNARSESYTKYESLDDI